MSAGPDLSMRCSACDRYGCWEANPWCPFYGRCRESHADASMGDTVPHMQGMIQVRRLGISFHGAEMFDIDGATFSLGGATGEDNNCLIDTLGIFIVFPVNPPQQTSFETGRILLLNAVCEITHSYI